MRTSNLGLIAVMLAMSAGTAWAASGRAIYDTYCASCHSGNMDNAPQISKPEQWAVRLTYGRKSLIYSVKNGHNMMPVHEGQLSEKDIGVAVDYIVGKVGGWPKM